MPSAPSGIRLSRCSWWSWPASVSSFSFRRRLSQRIVALSLLTSLFVLGVSALAFFGLLGGTGPLVFVAFSILVGTLYGFRSGLMAGASSVVIYILAALGIRTGLLPIYAIAADKYLHSIPFWIYVGADMSVVIISAIYCISEIQERMVSAMAISRAEHTFATAALNVQRDLFIVIDPVTFKPVHWNLTLRRLSGLTESEIKSRPIPKGWASFVDPVAAEAGLVKLEQGEVETFEIAIRAASGGGTVSSFSSEGICGSAALQRPPSWRANAEIASSSRMCRPYRGSPTISASTPT